MRNAGKIVKLLCQWQRMGVLARFMTVTVTKVTGRGRGHRVVWHYGRAFLLKERVGGMMVVPQTVDSLMGLSYRRADLIAHFVD